MCINNGILTYDDVYGGRLLIGKVQQISDSTTKFIWESRSMTGKSQIQPSDSTESGFSNFP